MLSIYDKAGVRRGAAEIRNPIGKFFRRHNLIEYKNPRDAMDIDVFYKVLAYACLYKVEDVRRTDERPAEDITVTLVRHRYPRKLFGALKREGYRIGKRENGIYTVGGKRSLFTTQVVVTRELTDDAAIWLRSLTDGLTIGEIGEIADWSTRLSELDDRENAEAIMKVVDECNHETIREWEDKNMAWKGWDDIYEPRMKAREALGVEKGMKKGERKGFLAKAQQVYDNCISRGMSEADALAISGLEEARKAVEEYEDTL